MSNVLVTGGSGFLGRAVAARLDEARILSSKDLDLTDGRDVMRAIGDWQPEVVVHLAARVGGITANVASQADFLIDNLRIDANLLAALRTNRPKHFLPVLSSCMYPDRLPDDRYPMVESLIEQGPPPATNAAYAMAKRALLHGTQALHQQYGVPYTALIPSNLYGPGDHFGESSSHFLAAAVDKIEQARCGSLPEVEFFGTGRALRQFVFVEDVAKLIAHLAGSGPLDEALNVAPRECLSIRQLAQAVAEAAGYEGKVTFSGRGPDGQFRKDVSTERLNALVPQWREMETSFADGVRQTFAWYRNHVATC